MDSILNNLRYDTVLDAFSGSGVVSYYFKAGGKKVTSNDLLKSSYITAKALIENNSRVISSHLLAEILDLPNYDYHDHVIENNYGGFYYTDEENIWLDAVISNIRSVSDEYAQAILYWALFQSCIIKRPYNLFHRKNLYMRLDDVPRSFGNKTTWDRPFSTHFKHFVDDANRAIIDNGRENKALNYDVSDIPDENFDLVYIDPPYMKQKKNMSGNDYQNYYHFLEGILDYNNWSNYIQHKLKHNPYTRDKSRWISPKLIEQEFENLIKRFQDSTLVISYNMEGFPSPSRLEEILSSHSKEVRTYTNDIKYVLKSKTSTEILIVAK